MSCWEIGTAHQLSSLEHDWPGFNITIFHMLPSPKCASNFRSETAPNQHWHMLFLHRVLCLWRNPLQGTSEAVASCVHKATQWPPGGRARGDFAGTGSCPKNLVSATLRTCFACWYWFHGVQRPEVLSSTILRYHAQYLVS
jgi:hypothetical protein